MYELRKGLANNDTDKVSFGGVSVPAFVRGNGKVYRPIQKHTTHYVVVFYHMIIMYIRETKTNPTKNYDEREIERKKERERECVSVSVCTCLREKRK